MLFSHFMSISSSPSGFIYKWYTMCPFLELSTLSFFSHQVLVTPWTAACQGPLFSTVSRSLLRFMSFESVMLSNHLIFCCPLLLLPSIFLSIRVWWFLVFHLAVLFINDALKSLLLELSSLDSIKLTYNPDFIFHLL